jgi:hypothetical protein
MRSIGQGTALSACVLGPWDLGTNSPLKVQLHAASARRTRSRRDGAPFTPPQERRHVESAPRVARRDRGGSASVPFLSALTSSGAPPD